MTFSADLLISILPAAQTSVPDSDLLGIRPPSNRKREGRLSKSRVGEPGFPHQGGWWSGQGATPRGKPRGATGPVAFGIAAAMAVVIFVAANSFSDGTKRFFEVFISLLLTGSILTVASFFVGAPVFIILRHGFPPGNRELNAVSSWKRALDRVEQPALGGIAVAAIVR
jgi:hypothetical protein